jgi:hypothetical protein
VGERFVTAPQQDIAPDAPDIFCEEPYCRAGGQDEYDLLQKDHIKNLLWRLR